MWGYFIIFYWNMVMKMLKCKKENLMTSHFSTPSTITQVYEFCWTSWRILNSGWYLFSVVCVSDEGFPDFSLVSVSPKPWDLVRNNLPNWTLWFSYILAGFPLYHDLFSVATGIHSLHTASVCMEIITSKSSGWCLASYEFGKRGTKTTALSVCYPLPSIC